MLPKRHRLTTAAFNRFFKRGRRFHGTYLTLVYTPDDTFAGAVVVGKKVYRRAVDRNRLRRQLYPTLAAFKDTQAATGIFQCLVKPAAASVPVAAVRAELAALLAQAHKAR
jgi:ribonuclease P protein component